MASANFSGKCITVHCRTEPIINTFYYTWTIADFWTVYKNNTTIIAEIPSSVATDIPFKIRMTMSRPYAINFFLTDCKVFTEFSYRLFLEGDTKTVKDKTKMLYITTKNNVSNSSNYQSNLQSTCVSKSSQDTYGSKSSSFQNSFHGYCQSSLFTLPNTLTVQQNTVQQNTVQQNTTPVCNDIFLYTMDVSKFDDKYQSSDQTLTVRFEFYFPQKDLKNTTHMDILKPCKILSESESKFNSNDNMDSIITIKTNEKCLYISKSLLCSKSTVFNAMFNCDLKENTTNEVKILDIPYNVIKELLSCLYLLQIGILPGLNTDIETIYELFIAADKYDIQDVKSLCEHRLIMELTNENIIKLLDVACRHNGKILKKYGIKIMKLNITDIVNTQEFVTLIGKYPELLNRINKKVCEN